MKRDLFTYAGYYLLKNDIQINTINPSNIWNLPWGMLDVNARPMSTILGSPYTKIQYSQQKTPYLIIINKQ